MLKKNHSDEGIGRKTFMYKQLCTFTNVIIFTKYIIIIIIINIDK